jgi:HK97 family phage prohead protease
MTQAVSEFRFTSQPQVRDDGNPGRIIAGYVTKFGTVADVGGLFLEQVQAGAFKRAISQRQDVRALINHNANLVIGRTRNGSLALREDLHGLWFECDVARTSEGDNLLALVRRGDVNECSFGFVAVKEKWSKAKDSSGRVRDLRTLTDVDLFDVSVVTYPQYEGTSVSAVAAKAASTSAGAGRMSAMFPSGAPLSLPMEVRSRVAQALAEPLIPEEEREALERRIKALLLRAGVTL